jgi:hypothetical protein
VNTINNENGMRGKHWGVGEGMWKWVKEREKGWKNVRRRVTGIMDRKESSNRRSGCSTRRVEDQKGGRFEA